MQDIFSSLGATVQGDLSAKVIKTPVTVSYGNRKPKIVQCHPCGAQDISRLSKQLHQITVFLYQIIN